MIIQRRILFLLLFLPYLNAEIYLIYGLCSRMGDNLISYMHSKFLSYKYDVPLIYRPFNHSHNFEFSDSELKIHQIKNFKLITVSNENLLECLECIRNKKSPQDENIIFEIPYFPEDGDKTPEFIHLDIDWKDQNFKNILKKAIAPKYPLELVKPLKDHISIAIHIRLGNGEQCDEHLITCWPLKSPPLSYYTEQLAKIISLFPEQHFYVYLFTDFDNNQEIIDHFKKYFPSKNIIFDSNFGKKNLLVDFFSIANFHYLIRPLSNFSIAAAKLGDYSIEIEPYVIESVKPGIPHSQRKIEKVLVHI